MLKQTKNALILSIISVFLSISMLIGTTFAWFTDTASTGVNKITSGNLDISLSEGIVSNGSITYSGEVSEETKLFDEEARWEPGHVEVAYLKLENKGSLALKYQLKIHVSSEIIGKNEKNENIKLSDILKFGISDISASEYYATRSDAVNAVKDTATKLEDQTVSGEMLPDDTRYLALIIYMPESIGNEANFRGSTVPSIMMGVNLVATQLNSEQDSFGDDYDDGSIYPDCVASVNKVGYTSFSEAFNAASSGDTIILYDDLKYSGTLSFNKNVSLDLNGNKLISTASGSGQYPLIVYSGYDVTIKNGSVETVYATVTQGNLTLENVDFTTSFSQAISPRGGVLTIDKDSTVTVTNTASNAVAISLIGNNNGANPTVKVYGRINCAGAYAIAGNGNNIYWGTTIYIYQGAELNAGLCGIFHPQAGVVNIYGGEISALRSAIEMRSGTLNIQGGVFTATSDKFNITAANSGLTSTGVALAVSQHTTNEKIDVTVSGGTFNGIYALYETDTITSATPSENVSITVTGGTFNGKVESVNNKITDQRSLG